MLIKYNSNVDPYEFAKLIWKQNGVKHFDIDPELDQKLTRKKFENYQMNQCLLLVDTVIPIEFCLFTAW